jgi:ketosteroid isomerase-like protein
MEFAVNSPQSVTNAFVRAINRQDADGVASLMTPGHRFVDSLGNLVEGREYMGKGWTSYFLMVPDYTLAIEETYESGPVVLLLGMAQGTYAQGGNLSQSNAWKTPIAIRAQVEDGLIAEWRVFADNEPIRKLMAKGA